MKAQDVIRKVIHPALADDFELENFLVNRAYNLGVPLDKLRGKNRDELILMILKPAPSQAKHWSDLTAIAQTVPTAVKTGDMLLAENQALRKVLASIASNLRIHLQVPTQSITLNRAEVEAMARECEVE